MCNSIWSINGTQTGTITSDLIGPDSQVNEGLLHIPQTPALEPSRQK